MEIGTFEAFHRLMYTKVLRYALRRLDDDSAEDVAARTMQAVWDKNIDDPVDEGEERQLQSLTYKIAEGLISNERRAQARRRELNSRIVNLADRRDAPDIADLVVDDQPGWVQQLPVTDREVLSLIVDGYAVGEIAVILGVSPAAVTMRLQRAKKNLKAIIGRGES